MSAAQTPLPKDQKTLPIQHPAVDHESSETKSTSGSKTPPHESLASSDASIRTVKNADQDPIPTSDGSPSSSQLTIKHEGVKHSPKVAGREESPGSDASLASGDKNGQKDDRSKVVEKKKNREPPPVEGADTSDPEYVAKYTKWTEGADIQWRPQKTPDGDVELVPHSPFKAGTVANPKPIPPRLPNSKQEK